MRPAGSRAVLRERRKRALDLLRSGLSLRRTARTIGCSPSSVRRWRAQVIAPRQEERPGAGRPRKLSVNQARDLVRLLRAGPQLAGFDVRRWSTASIALLIWHRYGVAYSRSHISRLMRSMGWEFRSPSKNPDHGHANRGGWHPGSSELLTWVYRRPRAGDR